MCAIPATVYVEVIVILAEVQLCARARAAPASFPRRSRGATEMHAE